MYSTSKPPVMLLLPNFQMEESLHGARAFAAETAARSRVSFVTCGRFKRLSTPSRPFWQMDMLLPGVIQGILAMLFLVIFQQFGPFLMGFLGIFVYFFLWLLKQPRYGGDTSEVQGLLKNVQQIEASKGAFAAVTSDGKVVTWGDPEYGGDCRNLVFAC